MIDAVIFLVQNWLWIESPQIVLVFFNSIVIKKTPHKQKKHLNKQKPPKTSKQTKPKWGHLFWNGIYKFPIIESLYLKRKSCLAFSPVWRKNKCFTLWWWTLEHFKEHFQQLVPGNENPNQEFTLIQNRAVLLPSALQSEIGRGLTWHVLLYLNNIIPLKTYIQ